jgi:hypothetical protein
MRLLGLIVLTFLAVTGVALASDDVREAATEAGYGSIAKRLADASLPTVFVRPRPFGATPAALGTSRTGGAPDLPPATSWPRCKGQPQSFLAQIRVRDLPPEAAELRRAGGSLLFFTYIGSEDGPFDEDGPWEGDCSAVVHARVGAPLTRTKPPGSRTLHMRVARLRFALRPDVPDLALDADHLMPPLQDIVPEGGWEKWFDFRDAVNGKPRMETKLLGYANAPNGGNACWQRAERKKSPWRHLLTVGPDDAVDFVVADAGRIQFLIAPADLRTGRFDRVCGVFDSG